MSFSLYKTATSSSIKKLLKVSSAQLTNYDKMPNNFLIDKEECSAIAEYKFGDFK